MCQGTLIYTPFRIVFDAAKAALVAVPGGLACDGGTGPRGAGGEPLGGGPRGGAVPRVGGEAPAAAMLVMAGGERMGTLAREGGVFS